MKKDEKNSKIPRDVDLIDQKHKDSLKYNKRGQYPEQRIWPTDNEKKKGPKI